jgi:hypothetical protein
MDAIKTEGKSYQSLSFSCTSSDFSLDIPEISLSFRI